MNITSKQLAKAKATKSAEELFAYAKEIGYSMTEEEARQRFNMWHGTNALADEELDNTVGGCGGDDKKTVTYLSCKNVGCSYTTKMDGDQSGNVFQCPYCKTYSVSYDSVTEE